VYSLPSYVWVMVLIGVVGIPATTCVVLYRGAIAVGLGRRRGALVAVVAGIVLAAWIVASSVLAVIGAYRQDPVVASPWVAVAVIGVFAAAVLATRIPVVSRILADTSTPARLALPQTLRVVGMVFLVVLALGKLPAVFALPAGLGDIAVGLAALFVARRLRHGVAGGGAVWFNVMGIVDLVVAVGIGFLAGLGPTRLLMVTPSTEAIALLPPVLIPTVAVPLAAALHVISLVKLRATVRATRISPQPATAAN
jgi:hypothetical protein